MPALGKTAARGYGSSHARERKRLAVIVASGGGVCSRCGLPISPGMAWDLDHTDDRSGYAGPSHRSCNRSAGARKANRKRRRASVIRAALVTSRRW